MSCQDDVSMILVVSNSGVDTISTVIRDYHREPDSTVFDCSALTGGIM